MTRSDRNLILDSLRYTREAFESYPYQTPALRDERLADVRRAADAVRAIEVSGGALSSQELAVLRSLREVRATTIAKEQVDPGVEPERTNALNALTVFNDALDDYLAEDES